MLEHGKFPCPCCGQLVYEREPGFNQTCPICGWKDDLAQLRFPPMPGSSNTVSLLEAQKIFRSYGSPSGVVSATRAPTRAARGGT